MLSLLHSYSISRWAAAATLIIGCTLQLLLVITP
jgi:hypothetical protein